MNRSPAQAYADLSDAMTRMTALNLQLQTDVDHALLTAFDAQVDRAMEAFQELSIQQDALRDIEALLSVTYGGVPS